MVHSPHVPFLVTSSVTIEVFLIVVVKFDVELPSAPCAVGGGVIEGEAAVEDTIDEIHVELGVEVLEVVEFPEVEYAGEAWGAIS